MERKNMKTINKKTKASLIAIILMLTITGTSIFCSFPSINAHLPPWSIPTTAYIVVTPNPIGVGQQASIIFWLDWIPIAASGIGGDRWTNLKIEITTPNGEKQTLGPFISDPIGGSYTAFTPDQIGTYSFNFSFPGQIAHNYHPVTGVVGSTTNVAYVNDTFLPSSATTTLTVQNEQIGIMPNIPTPSEYWARPIDGQNTQWYQVASNWVNDGSLVQRNGIAPNSPHIMWTKPLQDGGVVGGSYDTNGQTFYTGDSYEIRFPNPIVMSGRLYYVVPLNHGDGQRVSGAGYKCIDLRTGEEIWYNDKIATPYLANYWGAGSTYRPSALIGQLFDYESMNQHGVINGILWDTSTTTWQAYDAYTGRWIYNLTNVPSGTQVYTDKGEIVRYVLNNAGHWLALWNNTADQTELQGAFGTGTDAYQWRPIGKIVDMSKAYSWNVTIPNLPGSASPTIIYAIPNDVLLGRSSTLNSYVEGTPDPYTFWAISLKPETRGQLLWIKNYPAPPDNTTIMSTPLLVDKDSHVFVTYEHETMLYRGYSLDNGELIWGPLRTPGNDWDYYSASGHPTQTARVVAYGNLYISGFAGLVHCVEMKTGKILWTYGNGGAGNSTYSGLDDIWGNYPTFIALIADGKVYTHTSEHSTSQPIYRGQEFRCLNATTGEQIWTLYGHGERYEAAVADGYFVFFNGYDQQIYSIGKGPSDTTVSASPKVSVYGNSVLIEGSVIDIAAGTKQAEQIARFPDGVPAVSDASMSDWMEYVYMQKPRPTNATGVNVDIDVIDANGNNRNIGSTTSNIDGFFSFNWKPDIEGKYTVIAKFQGSESYWPSHAVTAFNVDAASPTPTQLPETVQSPVEMYVLGTGFAIILAIAIATVLIIRKRP
jgi:hypothetical protein